MYEEIRPAVGSAAAAAVGTPTASGLESAQSKPSKPGPPASSSSSSNLEATPDGTSTQEVMDAVVASGLQAACRVVRLRRRLLADVLDSMLTVG